MRIQSSRPSQATPRPTVSACLIVKDEATNLPRCLASLRGIADQIVVVDTGSSDDTVAIAEAAGCTIGHFAWCDDFSAARNASLALATGDWILVIDADEEWVTTDAGAWARALADPATGEWRVRIGNVGEGGGLESELAASPRLVRRMPGLRFEGRLHEDLGASIQALGLVTRPLNAAWIRHHGYAPAVMAQRDKPARNLRLAEAMAADRPDDVNAWGFVASGRWLVRDAAGTLEAVATVRSLLAGGAEWAPHRRRAMWLIEAWAHEALGDLTSALQALEEGLGAHPGYAEFLFERGRLRANVGDREGARADFTACLSAPLDAEEGTVRLGITGYLAHAELMGLAADASDLMAAAHHARQAAQDPHCPAAEASRLRALAKRLDGGPKRSPVTARADAERRAGDAVALMDQALAAIGDADWDGARGLLLTLLAEQPRSAPGFLALAHVSYSEGRIDHALIAILQALGLDSSVAAAYHLLGLILDRLGQPEWAGMAFAAVLQLDPDHGSAQQCRLAMRGRRAEVALDTPVAAAVEQALALLRPRVSACLIVKDEAANLPRCLASLKGLVDEIVVVDTGSTDETVAIATAAGCTVGQFAWCDDFSAARNASLDLATGDWLLVIDADEELIVDDPEAWMNLLRRREPGAYMLPLLNLDEQGQPIDKIPVTRLMQRLPAVRFSGLLHENVQASLDTAGLPTAHVDAAHFKHWGYQAAAVTGRGKAARNLLLAERQVANAPGDAYAAHHLALALIFAGREDEAFAWFERIEAEMGGLEALPQSWVLMHVDAYAAGLRARGRHGEAQALLDRGLALMPEAADLHYLRGMVRVTLGDRAGAIADFEACLQAPRGRYAMTIRPEAFGELPRRALAELGVEAPAQPTGTRLEQLSARLASQPRDPRGLLELAFLAREEGQDDQALEAVLASLRLDSSVADAYLLLGFLLEAKGQPVWAERAFAATLQLDPDHASARQFRVALRGRRPEVALDAPVAAAVEQALALLRPRVSACLIVKDEAGNLPRCLASLKGLVDEIVVVDTGSTDETVAIATAAGCTVGHFAWCDDFSAARNASLDLATGDWLLVIDADEELIVDDPEAWMNLLRRRVPGIYRAPLANTSPDGQERNRIPAGRLMQRDPRVRFSGRLHETVSQAVAALGWPVLDAEGFHFRHHGYNPEAIESLGKAARNLRLVRLDAAERPDDPVTLLNLGRTLQLAGEDAEALEVLGRLATSPDGVEGLPPVEWGVYVMIHMTLLWRLGHKAEAEQLLDRAIARLPGFPDFHFDRALMRLERGDRDGAKADLELCLKARKADYNLFMREGITDELPRRALQQLNAPRPRPTVSACLIVKNEAANLPRCLASLIGVVDQIVVVDTGSTDDTVAIAEAAGCTIGHFAWCDDFSAARNASLALATGDWILVIDADEALVLEDPRSWAGICPREAALVLLPLFNLRPDGTREPAFNVPRLFRRDDRIRFEGRLHEGVGAASTQLGWPVLQGFGACIEHVGYRQGAQGDRLARNLHLAKLDCEEHPDHALSWFNLARSAAAAGDHAALARARESLLRIKAAGLDADPFLDQYLPFLEQLQGSLP